MKACNAQAGDKKLEGDPRKSFMSDCLKAGMPMTEQEKIEGVQQGRDGEGAQGRGPEGVHEHVLGR
jgi:hypothetical protein